MKDKKFQDLELLRNKANLTTILNQFLKTKLDMYNKYIDLTKKTMTKSISNKETSIEIFNSYINEIKKDYDILKTDYENNYLSKYQSLLDNYFDEINMGRPVLLQNINEEFTLNYFKDKFESVIRGLKDSIKLSKEFSIFREPKRDSLVETTIGNKEIEKTSEELQQCMLYECKNCNKFKYKIKKSNYLISEMKKNISILKKYLEDEKSKNKKDDKIDTISNEPTNENEENIILSKGTFKNERNNLEHFTKRSILKLELDEISDEERAHNKSDEDNRGFISNRKKEIAQKFGNITKKKTIKKQKSKQFKQKKRNSTITNFIKVEDLFNISIEEGEKEKIIDEELHSDEESNFEIKIKQQKQMKNDYFDKIRQTIPEINLKQIEYNKLRAIKEVDRYSIQRRKYKKYNIKELKSKIEQMNYKANLLEQKEKVMKEFIKKNKENYMQLKLMKDTLTAYRKRLSGPINLMPNIDLIKEEENDLKDFFDSDNEEEKKEKEKGNEIEKEKVELEKEIKKKEKINKNNIDFKVSFIYGKGSKKKMEDKFFKNNLKEKTKKRNRAKSK